ncbi:MAG TPA: hypothetical protein VL354_18085 [Spirochaetia bacterium]|nr:hypothetical protein [Spirochaetia bacterium]
MDRLLELFAGILESPGMNLVERVRECARAATAVGVPPEDLEEFARFAENAPQETISALYRTGSPTVGQQLYGEGYGRSMLVLDLQKRYRQHGFDTGEDPVDGLAVLLRFLSECDDPAERAEITREVLVPSLEAMIADTAGEGPGAFTPVLRALSAALKEQVGS